MLLASKKQKLGLNNLLLLLFLSHLVFRSEAAEEAYSSVAGAAAGLTRAL